MSLFVIAKVELLARLIIDIGDPDNSVALMERCLLEPPTEASGSSGSVSGGGSDVSALTAVNLKLPPFWPADRPGPLVCAS